MEKLFSPEAISILPKHNTSERQKESVKINLPRLHASFLLEKCFPHVFSTIEGQSIETNYQTSEGYKITITNGMPTLFYHTQNDMYKALGDLAAHGLKEKKEKPLFEERSLMIDVSRNAVLKPEVVEQDILPRLALMGINQLVLYAEDTIYDELHPKIGYQRGAYTKKEIKSIVGSAKEFGIEVVPAIQTLSHLSHILKYREYRHLAENFVTLNPSASGFEDFIRQRIQHVSDVFGTKKIHIGGDEPEGLGRGRSVKDGQEVQRLALFQKYIGVVAKVAEELGIEPIMWGDVLTGMYGHPNLLVGGFSFPKNISLDIWGYEDEDPQSYTAHLDATHQRGIASRAVMAFHSWNRFFPAADNYTKTAYPFLEAAKNSGTKKVMATIWGDDGNECSYTSIIPLIYDFAERAYSGRNVPAKIEIFEKVSPIAFQTLQELNNPIQKEGLTGNFYTKALLFDDPLLRIASSHTTESCGDYYRNVKDKLVFVSSSVPLNLRPLFAYGYALADCLSEKADLGNKAYIAYKNGDKKALGEIVNTIPLCNRKIQRLYATHMALWNEENKPFGREILDHRYWGLMGRMEVFRDRLLQYLSGDCSSIPEYDTTPQIIHDDWQSRTWSHHEIYSPAANFRTNIS